MKTTSIAAIFLVSFVILSCSGQSAVKYNNLIVEQDSSLLPAIEKAESDIAKFAAVPQWDSVAAVSKRMEAVVDTRLQLIMKKDAPDVAGAEDFKRGALRYFKFIKDIYAGYGKLALQSTDQARLAEYDKFTEMVKQKTKVVEDFQAEQRRFAKQHNIRLTTKK